MEITAIMIAVVLICLTIYLAKKKSCWGLFVPIIFALLGGMYSIIEHSYMETIGTLCNSFSLINAIIFFGITTKK